MNKRHPVVGLILLFVAVFIVLGGEGGALGQHLAAFAARCFGQTGALIVVGALVFSAYLLGAPAGTATKIARSIRVRRRPEPAARVEVAAAPALPVVDRRKADDVRSAMKSLGYLKHEYDPVVSDLDLALPLDQLVRQAIQKLHGQVRLS